MKLIRVFTACVITLAFLSTAVSATEFVPSISKNDAASVTMEPSVDDPAVEVISPQTNVSELPAAAALIGMAVLSAGGIAVGRKFGKTNGQ